MLVIQVNLFNVMFLEFRHVPKRLKFSSSTLFFYQSSKPTAPPAVRVHVSF